MTILNMIQRNPTLSGSENKSIYKLGCLFETLLPFKPCSHPLSSISLVEVATWKGKTYTKQQRLDSRDLVVDTPLVSLKALVTDLY